jgi:hypothetical protein
MSGRAALVAGVWLAAMVAAGPASAAAPSAVAADAGRARPAESGARDSAATLGPLAIGVAIHDPTGAEIGHVALITTDKDGRSVAKVRHGEDTFAIPVAQLYASGGRTFCRLTLGDLKHGKQAP